MTQTDVFVASEDRALATVERITALNPIPGAERILSARVRGWDVVVMVDEFEVGDLCVYFEVDAMVDVTDARFAFLANKGVRTDESGRTGHVLKTARFKGKYSQGLALPVTSFATEVPDPVVGLDVTAALKIVKWDPPIPAELVGSVRGMRPNWISATAEARIQNFKDVLGAAGEARWVPTEKADGESTTFYVDPMVDLDGVTTRNMDLLPSANNPMWVLARQHNIHARIRESFPGLRVAFQGETFGVGFKKNPLRLKDVRFAGFTLRVDNAEVPRDEWPQWALDLSVPVLDLPFPADSDDALAQVETLKSAINPDRAAEGVVWRAADRAFVTLPTGQVARASFKVVSNKYAFKNAE